MTIFPEILFFHFFVHKKKLKKSFFKFRGKTLKKHSKCVRSIENTSLILLNFYVEGARAWMEFVCVMPTLRHFSRLLFVPKNPEREIERNSAVWKRSSVSLVIRLSLFLLLPSYLCVWTILIAQIPIPQTIHL